MREIHQAARARPQHFWIDRQVSSISTFVVWSIALLLPSPSDLSYWADPFCLEEFSDIATWFLA